MRDTKNVCVMTENSRLLTEGLAEAARIVREMVAFYRRCGMKNEHAQEVVATALGVGRSRVWALLYDKAYAMPAAELEAMRAARRLFARKRILALEAEIAAERAVYGTHESEAA
jgi:hypothetical protein